MPAVLSDTWKRDTSNMDQFDLFDHFSMLLHLHDWYFDYSDDHQVWQVGSSQRRILQALKKRLDQIDTAKALKMYNDACPWIN